ncbi:MAG: hypothetical protein RIR53_387 [Bacteroidota bacterium]
MRPSSRCKPMRFITVITLIVIGAASIVAVSSDHAIGKRAKEFVLLDQYEKEWSWVKNCKGRPTVMVMSDWKGSDYTAAWTDPLVARFKDKVQFVALADVSMAPGFLEGYLRSRFRDAYKTPILLDFDGDVFEYYKFTSGVPNVLFIDASGTVRLHTWGKGTTESVNAVIESISKFL